MKKIELFLCLLTLSFLIVSCEEDFTPTASFTFTGANKSASAEVAFTNTSQNASTYLWEFGDGASSTEKHTKHTYTTGGTFTAKLTAYSGKNSNSTTSSIIILESVPNPVANFNFSENGNFAPSQFTFTNYSINGFTYLWDFGDNQTSTSQNPTHVFSRGGLFNVTLKVKNASGVENVISKAVTVKNAPTKLKINSILLSSFPATTTSGGGWDLSDGPDVFPQIIGPTGTTSYSTYRKENLTVANLPTTFSSGFPYTISSLDFQHTIEFYDYDPIGSNEWMGGYYFTVRNYMPTNGDQYPRTIYFQNPTSQLKFTLNVDWLQ